ncbi:D-alanyl-D-alanine carboxypeptidase family protein [Azotobacter vinelandii]
MRDHEHHTGHAVDLTTPGASLLETDFENTSAFRWFENDARHFNFHILGTTVSDTNTGLGIGVSIPPGAMTDGQANEPPGTRFHHAPGSIFSSRICSEPPRAEGPEVLHEGFDMVHIRTYRHYRPSWSDRRGDMDSVASDIANGSIPSCHFCSYKNQCSVFC